MLTRSRHPLALRDLLRLVALWLAVIVLAQGFAAAVARIEGPLHVHRPSESAFHVDHEHRHGDSARHHHGPGDPSVLTTAQDADADAMLQAAGAALSAAFLLLALGLTLLGAASCGHVWRPALPWAWLTSGSEALLKPPRHG